MNSIMDYAFDLTSVDVVSEPEKLQQYSLSLRSLQNLVCHFILCQYTFGSLDFRIGKWALFSRELVSHGEKLVRALWVLSLGRA